MLSPHTWTRPPFAVTIWAFWHSENSNSQDDTKSIRMLPSGVGWNFIAVLRGIAGRHIALRVRVNDTCLGPCFLGYLRLLDATLFYPFPPQHDFIEFIMSHRKELIPSLQLEEREDVLDHDTCTRCDASLLPHARNINLRFLCVLQLQITRVIPLFLIQFGLPKCEFKLCHVLLQ